jgi:hypothetical protein
MDVFVKLIALLITRLHEEIFKLSDALKVKFNVELEAVSE